MIHTPCVSSCIALFGSGIFLLSFFRCSLSLVFLPFPSLFSACTRTFTLCRHRRRHHHHHLSPSQLFCLQPAMLLLCVCVHVCVVYCVVVVVVPIHLLLLFSRSEHSQATLLQLRHGQSSCLLPSPLLNSCVACVCVCIKGGGGDTHTYTRSTHVASRTQNVVVVVLLSLSLSLFPFSLSVSHTDSLAQHLPQQQIQSALTPHQHTGTDRSFWQEKIPSFLQEEFVTHF